MSDLVPTPSQTQSPVSNDAFEALIDLLASDGMDENYSEYHTPRSQANVSLRDPSGKLDYDKIRLMFASQHARKPQRAAEERVQSVQTPTLPEDEDDSDDEDRSHRSTPSTSTSRSHSVSPKPVGPTTAGHRRSSTFGNQPWSPPIHIIVSDSKAEDVPPTLLPRPLSFDELNTALAGAQEEVKSLRQQYDHLQALVSKRFGAEKSDPTELRSGAVNTDKVTPENSDGRFETRETDSQAQPSAIPLFPLPSDVPTEIVDLSENEAKRALSALVHALNLSPSAMTAMAIASKPAGPTSPQQSSLPPSLNRQHDVASIACALKFLGTVDELVWRRTSTPSGPRTLLPVFSEENVVALAARLQLWERAVRRSSKY